MLDCNWCGGSNRVQFMPCPRCGLHNAAEMATLLTVVVAGSGTAAEQTAITTEEFATPDSPGTTG